MRRNGIFAITAVCMVVLWSLPLGVAVADTGSTGLDMDTDEAFGPWGGKTTPFTASQFDGGDFVGGDRVVSHGEGLPGWYVWYDADDDDAFANFEVWLDSSDDRRLLEHDQADGRVLIAAPADHIRRTSWLSADGLFAKPWVEGLEIEQRVDVVEPVDLKSKAHVEAYQGPTRRARALAWFGGGAFSTNEDGAKGVAYSDDVNRTDMSDVKRSIGADAESIPSSADGSSTKVAVLDTGANVGDGSDRGVVFGNGSSGSDVRITDGKNFVTGETINTSATPENRTYDAIGDGDGHGTYTAARIAGAAGGNPALRSPAYKADLAVGKVLGDDGSGSIENIVSGLEWACSDGVDADVVSMSLGSPRYSKALEDETHDCLAEDDVSAVVVAAGNSRWTTGRANIGSPADADGAITVVATTTSNASHAEIAYFANTGPDGGVVDGSNGHTRGENPDVGAPGMENTVLVVDSSGTARNATLSGTSMSTPDVAATAAVLVDESPELRGEHDVVRERILETAEPAPNIGVTEIGNGLLNVSNALDDRRPAESQADARTEQSKARDAANEALVGRFATFLKSNGVDV